MNIYMYILHSSGLKVENSAMKNVYTSGFAQLCSGRSGVVVFSFQNQILTFLLLFFQNLEIIIYIK